MCTCSESHQNCFCYWGIPPTSKPDPYWDRPWVYTSPYFGEAWHRVTPKRKSGGPLRDPSQRRIAKYNYHCQRPEEYLESWQSELLNHPRHIRWARRKRQSL